MQNLIVIGNLGADAEVRVVNEKKFVSFKIADTQRFTDNKGVAHDKTSWISCAWNSDGGNLLQYLKKGSKVMVIGRPSYKVYSSQKERMMMAGVDLHVLTIELAGGSNDNVPKKLIDPKTGQIIETQKYYWVSGYNNCQLLGERGGFFNVDAHGFVFQVLEEQQGGSESDGQEERLKTDVTSCEGVVVFSEQSKEAQNIVAQSSKKNGKNK